MTITSVNVKKLDKEKVKGLATVVIDDAIAIHDIRIIQGENGLWVAMPSRKTATGEYRDVAHPISAEARKAVEEAVFAEYNNAE